MRVSKKSMDKNDTRSFELEVVLKTRHNILCDYLSTTWGCVYLGEAIKIDHNCEKAP